MGLEVTEILATGVNDSDLAGVGLVAGVRDRDGVSDTRSHAATHTATHTKGWPKCHHCVRVITVAWMENQTRQYVNSATL